MTKDKEPIDFFDAEGNRIGTLDATTSKNEFNPDWNQMAVLVEQSQEQAAKIEQLEAHRRQDRNAMDAMKLANEQWTQECRRLEKQLAERSAEYLAAHITYDNGYEAGRQDEREECAKVCLDTEPFYGVMFANAIRAREKT